MMKLFTANSAARRLRASLTLFSGKSRRVAEDKPAAPRDLRTEIANAMSRGRPAEHYLYEVRHMRDRGQAGLTSAHLLDETAPDNRSRAAE